MKLKEALRKILRVSDLAKVKQDMLTAIAIEYIRSFVSRYNAIKDYDEVLVSQEKKVNECVLQELRSDFEDKLSINPIASLVPIEYRGVGDLADKFKRIKEVVLSIGIILTKKGGYQSPVRAACIRCRLLAGAKYKWLLEALPSFEGSINDITSDLATLEEKFATTDDIVKARRVAELKVMISYFVEEKPSITQIREDVYKPELNNVGSNRYIEIEGVEYREFRDNPESVHEGVDVEEQLNDQVFDERFFDIKFLDNKDYEKSGMMTAIKSETISNQILRREKGLKCSWDSLSEQSINTLIHYCYEELVKKDLKPCFY